MSEAIHSSCRSRHTAVMSRSAEASFGKIPTIRVQRLISALTRSQGVIPSSVAVREASEGAEVILGVAGHVGGDVGPSSWPATCSSCASTDAWSDWAKIILIIAETIWPWAFGGSSR